MLRPSNSFLSSSRSTYRANLRAAQRRFFSTTARGIARLVSDLVGAAWDLLILFGLPLAYAVANYLVLDTPARWITGRDVFTGTGMLVFLAALGVSTYGVTRLLQDAPPIAPVRPVFARAMAVSSWVAALLLTAGDLTH